MIERPPPPQPGLSLQGSQQQSQQQLQQQQPIPMMSQHHHGNPHGMPGGPLSALSASLNAAPMQMRPISGLLGPSSGQIAANQAHITDLSVQS